MIIKRNNNILSLPGSKNNNNNNSYICIMVSNIKIYWLNQLISYVYIYIYIYICTKDYAKLISTQGL